MSKIEVRSLERAMRSAVIAGKLERAEEKGIRKGRETTENLFISKLLEKHDPEEISKEYEIPLERVLEIKNKDS